MSVTLSSIQTEIAARLAADSYFADITVLEEHQKHIVNDLAQALGGITTKGSKIGAFVFVAGAAPDVSRPDAPGPLLDEAAIGVNVVEIPLFNKGSTGTQKNALDIAVRALQVLHHYRPDGLAQTIVCKSGAIRPVAAPDANSIAYRAEFTVTPNIDADPRVATPVISPATGVHPQTITLTCGTSGASIYYTTDDSHPAAGNSRATLYTVPFSAAAAGNIRAIAYKTGMIASDSALSIIT